MQENRNDHRARAVNIRLKHSDFTVYVNIDHKLMISKIVLKYRNILRPLEYDLHYQITKRKNGYLIKIFGNAEKMSFWEGDWDVYLCTEQGEYLPVILDPLPRLRLIFGNYQLLLKEDHILFPLASTGHMLTFRYRISSVYDCSKVFLRENLTYIFYRLTKPVWKRKKIWVVYEKYCIEAQDNGYYFFKYCMENLPDKEKKKVYYILDEKSPQWEQMQKYGKNLVPFMSTRHILYMLAAEIYIASDAKNHGFAWKPKPNIISREISKKKILFLQHGVTALKKVDHLFGKNGSAPMTYFAVTSQYEQKIVTKYFGYSPENVPILGFTRWDVLQNKCKADRKNILIMPTWRPWLEEQSREVFQQSEYCRRYRELLEDKELSLFLREKHVRIVFHIHPKMKEYLQAFQTENDQVELIEQGSQPLNDLIMKCSMLITDYSSVSWDVYYLGKPVLFYQFDYDLYQKANGSYLDMETELFGDRCMEQMCLSERIKEYVENDFKEKDRYAQMRKEHFAYRDRNNSRRTLEFIKSRGC